MDGKKALMLVIGKQKPEATEKDDEQEGTVENEALDSATKDAWEAIKGGNYEAFASAFKSAIELARG